MPSQSCGGGCGKIVRGSICYDCRESARRKARRWWCANRKLALAAKGRASKWVWTSGPCAWCDQPFVARATEPARYCSQKCSSRSRQPRKGFKIRPADRLAIYERDNWTCQLCLKAVDPNLGHLDNWAASLDHIECQAWALIPDHSPRNLRLAHRWCNSKRGDESYRATAA